MSSPADTGGTERLQRRIAQIELADGGASLPPISRLSFDILSLVFQMCGQEDWKAPLRIGFVNRQFREAILATPRAWTFIRLNESYEPKLMDVYFERSGLYLHHTHPNALSDFDRFRRISHRIQCLVVKPTYLTDQLSGVDFPNLTRLRLDNSVSLSVVAAPRFSALRHLSVPCIDSDPLPTQLAFPPLQSLQLVVHSDTSWIRLLQGCQNTLISLRVGISTSAEFSTYPDVRLSKLQALWLTVLSDSKWSLQMRTPELATYVQYHSSRQRFHHLLHKDLNSVTSLCLHYVPSFFAFPKLHTFNLTKGSSNAHFEILSQLNIGDTIYPLLRLLELNMPYMSLDNRQEALKTMEEWVIRDRPGLVVRVTGPEDNLNLPEVTRGSCGYNMPCTV